MMNNRAWLLPALLLLAALPAFSLGSQEPPSSAAEPQTEQTANDQQNAPGDGEESDSMVLNVGDTVELRGRLRVVGNEPFTQLVLTLESPASDDQSPDAGEEATEQGRSGSYAIMDAFHDALMQRQQQIVRLRAEIIARPQAGMPGAIEVREILEE